MSRQPSRPIRASDGVQPSDRPAAAKAGDDSLSGDGIEKGDMIVYRRRFDESELTSGRLVVVETPGGVYAGHYYKTPAGVVRLVYSNPRYQDRELAGPVEVMGLVVRRERDYGGEP
jgi:SOS-response transcriptional repressor LexA